MAISSVTASGEKPLSFLSLSLSSAFPVHSVSEYASSRKMTFSMCRSKNRRTLGRVWPRYEATRSWVVHSTTSSNTYMPSCAIAEPSTSARRVLPVPAGPMMTMLKNCCEPTCGSLMNARVRSTILSSISFCSG